MLLTCIMCLLVLKIYINVLSGRLRKVLLLNGLETSEIICKLTSHVPAWKS